MSWRGEFAPRDHVTSLTVAPGRTLALVGPNGAGKSTTFDLLTGLLRPTRGRLTVGETVLCDTDRGVDVPTHRRRIALLGQEPLLFPHLDVAANIAFGMRSRGVPRAESQTLAQEWAERVGVAEFARRRPHQLSGGQAARVALARALASEPRVLLLDEPFAALDVDVAPSMRRVVVRELERTQVPTILVTHDLLDVVALADHVAVIDGGRLVECAPTPQFLRAPTSAFGASLVGVDHVRGTVVEEGLLRSGAGLLVRGIGADVLPGSAAVAVWSPSAVALYPTAPLGSPRNVWRGVVVDLADRGGVVRVRVELGPGTTIAADLSPAAVADLALSPGGIVHAVVKAQEVHLHPAR
ncbi:molybdate ABC transporter ATP-binding protein [Mobilicoccus pelagius NBRC 104925]|uniref:Molybdate ABC transporter ATP-binding protein n=1 Tax=Mobilicoccus pelagius NBRC 104925 TaxID=1089455 RepID=H5URE7_9MICO|nr:molybdate ABC transporter ATP-binding protein [Mobilicoccus pelagius NBRC 104925]